MRLRLCLKSHLNPALFKAPPQKQKKNKKNPKNNHQTHKIEVFRQRPMYDHATRKALQA